MAMESCKSECVFPLHFIFLWTREGVVWNNFSSSNLASLTVVLVVALSPVLQGHSLCPLHPCCSISKWHPWREPTLAELELLLFWYISWRLGQTTWIKILNDGHRWSAWSCSKKICCDLWDHCFILRLVCLAVSAGLLRIKLVAWRHHSGCILGCQQTSGCSSGCVFFNYKNVCVLILISVSILILKGLLSCLNSA